MKEMETAIYTLTNYCPTDHFLPDAEQLIEISIHISQKYFGDNDLYVHSNATLDIIMQ